VAASNATAIISLLFLLQISSSSAAVAMFMNGTMHFVLSLQ
jgi:hypothetical protein